MNVIAQQGPAAGVATPLPFHAATISSLKIAELADKRHAHVLRDIRKMLDELITAGQLDEGLSNFGSSYLNAQGKEQPCYELPLRLAKTLLVKYDTVRAYRVLQYIEHLEDQLKALAFPQDLPTALRLYADEVEKREAVERLLLEQKPMAMLGEAVMQNAEEMSITAAAKHFKIQPEGFFEFLRSQKCLIRREYYDGKKADFNEAASGMVQAGYMVVRQVPCKDSKTRPQTFITGKGLDWMRGLLDARTSLIRKSS